MTRSRAPSRQTVAVLHALAADPAAWRYGYELGQQVGLKAGSLYPILIRLADRGLLETRWEAPPPGRPARHLYRLTQAGLDLAAAQTEAAPAQAAQPGATQPSTPRPGTPRTGTPRPRALRPGPPEPQLDGT
jgi:DNA-binding PadR family transcriptional regulator